MKDGSQVWWLLRWFFGPVLMLLVAFRTRVRLATCATMLKWSIKVGKSADDPLRSGCVSEMMLRKKMTTADGNNESNSWFTDVSDITVKPYVLEEMILEEKSNNDGLQRQGIGNSSVPRILHQSYISTRISSAIYPFVQSWHEGLSRYPWTYVWWTDEDIRWLVHTHYREYATVWDRLPHNIMKADTARYFILHRYGGLYSDMDIEYIYSEKNQQDAVSLEDWFQYNAKDDKGVPYHSFVFNECADNALMASTRNATFWPIIFEEWKGRASNPFARKVNHISGIDMLKDLCDSPPMPGIRLATPNSSQFAYHHNTNTWRWKTKRDDIVRVCDVIILVHISAAALVWALSHYWLKVDVMRFVFSRTKRLTRIA